MIFVGWKNSARVGLCMSFSNGFEGNMRWCVTVCCIFTMDIYGSYIRHILCRNSGRKFAWGVVVVEWFQVVRSSFLVIFKMLQTWVFAFLILAVPSAHVSSAVSCWVVHLLAMVVVPHLEKTQACFRMWMARTWDLSLGRIICLLDSRKDASSWIKKKIYIKTECLEICWIYFRIFNV